MDGATIKIDFWMFNILHLPCNEPTGLTRKPVYVLCHSLLLSIIFEHKQINLLPTYCNSSYMKATAKCFGRTMRTSSGIYFLISTNLMH